MYTLGQDEIILVRDDDGSVNALFNVCTHRGSRLCLEPQGHVKTLVCPIISGCFAATVRCKRRG
jgi:Rieske 2Fe-2S family protein